MTDTPTSQTTEEAPPRNDASFQIGLQNKAVGKHSIQTPAAKLDPSMYEPGTDEWMAIVFGETP